MANQQVAISELRTHYNELKVFKKSIKTQVKNEFEAKIDLEVKRRTEEEILRFAQHVAQVKEREGLTVRMIQDEVLRTRTWSVWEPIRDLGEIEPELERKENNRREKKRANLVFEWIENVLHVYKNPATGENLPGTLVYPYYKKTGAFTGLSEGIFSEFENCIRRVLGLDNQESNKAFFLPIMQEIKRAFTTGELTEETAPDWREDSYDQEAEEIGEKMFELNGWVKR